MKRWLTTSNVLATIAMLCALAGTSITAAWAAPLLTGANVRNSTLTGADVKDGSLSSTDFTTAAKTTLKAMTGPAGNTGPQGATGSKGARGRTGPTGPDAGRAYSYVTANDTRPLMRQGSTTRTNPEYASQPCNNGGTIVIKGWTGTCGGIAPIFPHWAYDCDAAIKRFCGMNDDGLGGAGAGATLLTSDWDGVVGFTGDEYGGFVTLMGPGNLVVTGSLSLMHGEEDPYHSRVACKAQARISNSNNPYTDLGVPTIVSGQESLEVTHITVTGGAYFATPGNYDFQIACRQLDGYTDGQVDEWIFLSGNASATTTEM